MEHATPAVNVENARVYLGGHEILHNISWQVQRGERCFILGGQRRRKDNAGQGADGVCVAALRSQGAGSGQDLRAREPAGIAQVHCVGESVHAQVAGGWLLERARHGAFRPRRHYRPLEGADAGRGGKAAGIMKSLKAEHLIEQTGGSHVFRGTGESADCPGSDDESGTDDSGRTQRLSGFGRAGNFY